MNEKEKLKNLIVELYTMISDGGILDTQSGSMEIVGALELSQDSVDLVKKLYERDKKEGQQSN